MDKIMRTLGILFVGIMLSFPYKYVYVCNVFIKHICKIKFCKAYISDTPIPIYLV